MVSVTFFTALVAPTMTLPKASEAGETAAATTPVPESVIICGLLAPESISVTWPPEVAPVAVGAKSTPTMQLELAASEPPRAPPVSGQVVTALVSRTNGPLKMALLMVRALDWLFVTLIVFAALVTPITPLPKLIAVGETTTDATPVAESATVWAVALALVVTLSVPAGWEPSEVGVTASEMVQADPPASEAPHVVPAMV